MSRSVTPARRRRDEDELSDRDSDVNDISLDGGSTRSGASKRARLDNPTHHSSGTPSESPATTDGELFHANSRRSRPGRHEGHRTVNGLAHDRARSERVPQHHPGAIVRVALIDFVTYSKAEFHPGPNLNMIIGPNGTGKSTLVCAICLGLGWTTSHLGRAKDVGEFVRHGAKRAKIEIELAADPDRHETNPVITTKITKDGNKTEYLIGDNKSTRKGVQELARSFSIQVDNLCQFLPQDRVVEFAALSHVDLLTQTQRAAAPAHMSEWHDELKALRKEQKQSQVEEQKAIEIVRNLETRQRGQEADVQRFREREQLQERAAALEKFRAYTQYRAVRQHHSEAKGRKEEAERQLATLERKLAPTFVAAQAKAEYLERVEKIASQRERLVSRSESAVADAKAKIDTTHAKIADVEKEIEAEKQGFKATNQGLPKLLRDVRNTEKAMETPPADFDPAAVNEQVRAKTRQIRQIESEEAELKDRQRSLFAQAQQQQQIASQGKTDREHLQSQAGQQASKLRQASQAAAKAWTWIQENRDKFQSAVYGPPIVECSVKDQRNADAVESMIPLGELLAFTVTNPNDFKMLQDQLYGALKLTDINIRTIVEPLSYFRERLPVPTESLQQFGLESWLLDQIDGPDAVLAMLCDNRNIHQTAFTTRDISEDQFNRLQDSRIGSWVTPRKTYLITRRREYGDKATSTRVQALRNARFFTDTPVDRQVERDLEARILDANNNFEQLKVEMGETRGESRELYERKKRVTDERTELETEKNAKQRQISEFHGLPIKLERTKSKLEEAKTRQREYWTRRAVLEGQINKLSLEKGQRVLDFANAVEALRVLHIQLFEAQILRIEADSDREQLVQQHGEEARLLEEKRAEVTQLLREERELFKEGKKLQQKISALTAEGMTEFEEEIVEEISTWMPDQVETEIQSVQARLDMVHSGAGANTLREFNQRAEQIAKTNHRLSELRSILEELGEKIAQVRDRWEPELDELVSKISDAFAENFARIQCVGEVAIHKDEEFEHWAIQIWVKFRENEALSLLDSHRQSGGERAVSTIFYLMALQSLARAPFRVVDEINQGMDPRNERLVHSRMVAIACAEHTSQYFLITPKLLQGLHYHPAMKVHCIASGEYMPADHRELDFDALARRALELQISGGGGSGVGNGGGGAGQITVAG